MPISIIHATRRYAVGIDIHPREIRLAMLSCRWSKSIAIRIEHLTYRALPANTVMDTEFTDTTAIAAVIMDALAISTRRQVRICHAVMALPSSVVLLGEVSVAQLASHASGLAPSPTHFHTLEQALLAEAERLFRIEASALAIDWVQPSASKQAFEGLIIAVTPRQHIEARLAIAAQTGIKLTAIDTENAAALRACRFAATHMLTPEALYCVIWIGINQSHVWLVRHHHIEQTFLLATFDLSKPIFLDQLRRQAHLETPQQALLAGEIDTLDGLSITVEDISDALQCNTTTFNAASHCHLGKSYHPITKQSASFAVAFGLALRGAVE